MKHVCRSRPYKHGHTCSSVAQPAADHFMHDIFLYNRINRKLKEVKDKKHRPDYDEVYVGQGSLEELFRIDVDPQKWQIAENEKNGDLLYSFEVIQKISLK